MGFSKLPRIYSFHDPASRVASGQRIVIWPLGLLPVVLALFAYAVSSQHVESVDAILRTNQFIRNLNELLITMQKAETGQRGYLLTGDKQYLDPFNEASADLPNQWKKVVGTAQENNAFPETSALRSLINRKMAELRRTIELRRTLGLSPALALVRTDVGNQTMTQIRVLIERLKERQTATLHNRLMRQRKSEIQLDVVLGVGVVLAFLLFGVKLRLNSLYRKERDRTEAEIRRLNETLEVRVRERTQDLERSNSDLSQFAYIASHDLQEPLRMVESYVGLLERRYRGQLDQTADTYIEFVVSGIHRMQALINDLLSYSQAGVQRIEKRAISSGEVVQKALANLDASIREEDALISWDGLPVVQADEMKLTQVMQNLIGNAIKFRKPNVRPEVSIAAQKQNREWLFTVSDNGIGFEPEYRDRIFQVFQRLHGVGEYPGNGIGLSISRRIIEHHGGKLWAESEPDKGSRFNFTLPA